MTDWFQCSKTMELVTARYGWSYCPYCGAELKPRKYLIPEYHEVVSDDSTSHTRTNDRT